MERKSGGRNKRSNELTAEKKKWQTKFHNLHEKKKALKIKLLGKKRQTVMQNGSDTSVY